MIQKEIVPKWQAVFPGKKVQLELMGLDQFNLSTYIIARISDRQANINKGAFSQSTDSELLVNITVRTLYHTFIMLFSN